MEPFEVSHYLFNSLIVWNNPFVVDVPLTKKPDLPKQKLETVPEVNY